MVIECSSCHARFKLADDKVKESGTKVRCTKCREVFTVFPESPPPVTLPVMTVSTPEPVSPVVIKQQEEVNDALFSETDTIPFAAGMPPFAVDVPADEDDDWNQPAADNLFSDGFTEVAGASDLDAINFDDIEAPVFRVDSDEVSKIGLSDTISFNDSFADNESNQAYQITEATDEQSLSGESHNDFTADFFSTTLTTPQDLNPINTAERDSDFTFSGGDNLADLSWDELDKSPVTTTASVQPVNTGTAPLDSDFDFSSFSFDDITPSVNTDENKSAGTAAQSDAIEISTENGTAPAAVEAIPTSREVDVTSPPLAKELKEKPQRQSRPLRPRVRPKKKRTNRFAVKLITLILLGLAVTYGIKNRAQIEKTYNNVVNNFIENQIQVETGGRIDLVKLSGSYVHNNQEGDLFVIRGEAVNEFKGLRSSVLVKGTIYGAKGEALQSQSAYCGNPLIDSKLKDLNFKEIRDIMNNELGQHLVNLNIATGKGIPFTIVFNKAPKNIKEFTVEVLDSKPGSK